MNTNIAEISEDVQRYIKALENFLSEYTGFSVELPLEASSESPGLVTTGFSLKRPINYPYFDQFADRLVAKILDILGENKIQEIDWEIFYTLKEKLSLSFIFGGINNAEEEFKRLSFIRDLIFVGSKTYESVPANIGVIYCDTNYLDTLKNRYNCELLLLKEPLNIKDFFIREKPFLRIIDGETLNLLVNEEFLVIGLTRNISNNESLSQQIIDEFNKGRLSKNKNAVLEFIEDSIDNKMKHTEVFKRLKLQPLEGINEKKVEEILEQVIGLLKGGVRQAKVSEDGESLDFIYFKMENAKLSIYNNEDFIITFMNGEWKMKNYHLLQYVILQHALIRTHIYLPLEDATKESEILSNAVKGMDILLNTIEKLASTHESSIVMFLTDYQGFEQVSYSLTEQDAKHLITNAPLKKREFDNLYLEVIKRDQHHLNLMEVNEKFLSNLCVVDGALVLDDTFNIISYGEVIDVSSKETLGSTFGTGTNACEVASSNNGLTIKVSEDGEIKVYMNGRNIMTI